MYLNARTEVRVKAAAIEHSYNLKNILPSVFCERDLIHWCLKRFDPLVFNTITLSIIVQEIGF